MNLVEWLKRVMVSVGSEWVMWLMILLSVTSVAIILERAWFFNSLRDDLSILARDLQHTLEQSVEAAQRRMSASPSAEAAVVSAGLAVAHRGPAAAEEAMAGASALQRMKLERRLAYLATLGNNAPFIGLLGTVIGVVMAFEALDQQNKEVVQGSTQLASRAVMSSIGEALVATAVGIAVAIPAVVANNLFQRMTKTTLANTEALSRILLAHLKSIPGSIVARAPAEAQSAKDERSSKKTEAKASTKSESKAESKSESKATAKAASKPQQDQESEEEEG